MSSAAPSAARALAPRPRRLPVPPRETPRALLTGVQYDCQHVPRAFARRSHTYACRSHARARQPPRTLASSTSTSAIPTRIPSPHARASAPTLAQPAHTHAQPSHARASPHARPPALSHARQPPHPASLPSTPARPHARVKLPHPRAAIAPAHRASTTSTPTQPLIGTNGCVADARSYSRVAPRTSSRAATRTQVHASLNSRTSPRTCAQITQAPTSLTAVPVPRSRGPCASATPAHHRPRPAANNIRAANEPPARGAPPLPDPRKRPRCQRALSCNPAHADNARRPARG
ncbi:hypothetical protein FIBSPDRAFT_956494 [Athelia psychrophila]|uniref:Uncharacterized protein n=1 Tax=Athelia psychrophila TaxID=1759441 RepID=A0A166GSD2_9AGAM|nr:hypothetical protein FIBSPDRAFT_956494 [Fibularhizoctonia sp. CBS 109695]